MEIRPCTIAEINESGLAEGYSEYAIEGFPVVQVQWERYAAMEAAGIIQCIGAFIDYQLVGFAVVMFSVSLHYGVPLAFSESFFVLKQYRKTGAGMKLLKAIEQLAKDNGVAGVTITAAFDKELDAVLPKVGYKTTHRLYFKRV